MKVKGILYIGILLLLLGLLLRYLTPYDSAGLGLIIVGIILKFFYILRAVIIGQYRPQSEIYLLISGLLLLFLGLWYKQNINEVDGYGMITIAILLKLSFVIFFIRKTRVNRTEAKP